MLSDCATDGLGDFGTWAKEEIDEYVYEEEEVDDEEENEESEEEDN